jgi:hypothetical protein
VKELLPTAAYPLAREAQKKKTKENDKKLAV